MKKLIRLTLAVLFALAFCGCKTESDNPPVIIPPPLTLDQRLVGGRWYFSDSLDVPQYSNGYYEFTNDSKFIYSRINFYMFEIPVYSNNGIVYERETNKILLQYEFHNSFPYADTFLSQMRPYADFLAAKGNLITCTVSETYTINPSNPHTISLYPGHITNEWKFLVRFKEDGTPYRYYDE